MHVWHHKFDLDTTYIGSDFHFSHKNLVRGISNWEDKSACRDFDSLEDMNNAVISSINRTVCQDDVLFCLGDWSFGGSTSVGNFREQINCEHIALCCGNHDCKIRKSQTLQKNFAWCGDYLEIAVKGEPGFEVPSLIVLCHYAMRVWRDSHKSSIMLHAHSHGTLPQVGKSCDVGWDVWKRPISLREVITYLNDKPINFVDHHGESTT